MSKSSQDKQAILEGNKQQSENHKKNLLAILNARLDKYEKTVHNSQKKHVSPEQAGKIVTTGIGVGAKIGTVVPVIGNAIGGVVGGFGGVCVVGSIEAYYRRKNKKLANAEKVTKYLGQDAKEILAGVANKVIDDRKMEIDNIEEADRNLAFEFLAVNLMAAIKQVGGLEDLQKVEVEQKVITGGLNNSKSERICSHNLDGDLEDPQKIKVKIKLITDGLIKPRSHKISSCVLKTKNGHMTLKGLAQVGLFAQRKQQADVRGSTPTIMLRTF